MVAGHHIFRLGTICVVWLELDHHIQVQADLPDSIQLFLLPYLGAQNPERLHSKQMVSATSGMNAVPEEVITRSFTESTAGYTRCHTGIGGITEASSGNTTPRCQEGHKGIANIVTADENKQGLSRKSRPGYDSGIF